MIIKNVTVIIPYYNAPNMLQHQFKITQRHDDRVRFIVIDDGSQLHASDYIHKTSNVSLYRITRDVAWNRESVRNLGAYLTETDWLIQLDIDHVFDYPAAHALFKTEIDQHEWYRFPRYRIGKADDTRRKDKLADDCEYGEIKPHIDSYLMTRNRFLSSPYDQRYVGCLGGGSPFLSRMKNLYGEAKVLPKSISLNVFTKHVISDASVTGLSRDTTEYKNRRRFIESSNRRFPVMDLRAFEWERVF